MIKLPKYVVKYIIIFALYFIIAISFMLPLSENLHLRILSSEKTDLNGTLWYQWFSKRCLSKFDFASLYHTDFIAYPSGKNLLFDLGPPLIAFFSIPFQIVFNLPTYYNLFMVVLMAVNGLVCFMLINYIYKDTPTAFIGGLFFSINSYVFYQVNSGRPEQTAIFWIPLFILFLLKMKDKKRKSYTVIGALLLVLTSLSYWYYGIFLLIFTVLFLLYFLFIKKEGSVDFAKNTILLLCLFSVFMLLLFSYPVFIQRTFPSGYRPAAGPFPAFKDIDAVLKKEIPNEHPIFPIQYLIPSYYKYMLTNTASSFLPHAFLITTVILIILSLLNVKALKSNLFYIITASFFFILSLGPYLAISGHVIVLPYMLLYYIIPFFSRLWWPINCFSVTLVCVSILLAAFIHWLRLKENPITKIIFPVFLAVAYLFPYYNAQYNIAYYLPWLKMQAFSFSRFDKPHKAYYYLKEQQNCAIIEFPFNRVILDFFRNQIIHEKKVFDCPGYAIKETVWPKKQLQYLNSNALLKYVNEMLSYYAPTYQYIPNEQCPKLKSALKQLYTMGFRFIVFNPYYLKEYNVNISLFNELKKILKKPYKEYPDGLELYRIGDLINDAD